MADEKKAGSNGRLSEDLPLAVLLFHAAMEGDIPLSEFARKVGIGPVSLRQFMLGRTQRPRTKTFEMIADQLGLSVDEVRRRATLSSAPTVSFASWLQNHMQSRFSRAKLTRETGISDGALRNYLSGQTLPDTDQARRLAEALDIDLLDIARVIVANQTGDPSTFRDDQADHDGDGEDGVPVHTLTSSTFVAHDEARSPSNDAVPRREEDQLFNLWRQLHPQGRRATLIYIAGLLAEG